VPIGVKRLKVLTTCRELWVSGKPSSQSARGVDIPPTTRFASSGYLCSTEEIRVARATRNTGFVVALQTYVLHTLGVRMFLQSLVVDLSTSRNERQTVASE
jgi:hypothetical protein